LKSTSLATAPAADLVAYAAGSVAVLYNHKKNKQIGFLHASSTAYTAPQASQQSTSQSLSSAAFQNRQSVVDGFASNPLSSVGVPDPATVTGVASSSSKKSVATNKVKPISCLAFSPDGNYLAVGEVGMPT
jgi:hypothetical protein